MDKEIQTENNITMTVKEHYDNHLGKFYSWMIGDFTDKQIDFQNFLIEQKLMPQSSITAISNTLTDEGKFILSFRDYSVDLTGDNRFIPVKSDDNKILTCILDYYADYIIVTDLLYEKTENTWIQKISSYKKVRVTTEIIVAMIEQAGMEIQLNRTINGMRTIIARNNKNM